MNTREMAAKLRAGGLNALPARLDGSKMPDLEEWGPYQEQFATEAEFEQWFGNGRPRGLGVVTGRISGNLEGLDFDELTVVGPWHDLVEAECPGLTPRLVLIVTPRPGIQFWYRCEEPIGGNQKLAQRPTPGETPPRKTLIETRGEGGWILAPGGAVEAHPNKTPYQIARGEPWNPPVITAAEREVLLRCARTLNECVEPAYERTVRATPRERIEGEVLPGEDFNARGDIRKFLRDRGWMLAKHTGAGEYWRRPGKDRNWSATLGVVAPDVLHVFSTSCAPLEDGCNYDLFGVYGAYEHKGDYRAAAKALAEQGYGTPRPKREDPPLPGDDDDPERWQCQTPTPDAESEGFGTDEAVTVNETTPRILSLEEFLQRPDPEWEVDGVTQTGSLVVFYGDSEAGKTFVALDLALSRARGMDWHGRNTKPGPMLYIAAEGGAGLKPRVEAWLEQKEGTLPHAFHILPEAVNFLDYSSVGQFLEWVSDLPSLPAGIVVDTLARCFAGGDENSTKDMNTFVDACTRIQRHTGASVYVLHHMDKAGKTYRGSSALRAGADTMIEVEKRFNVISLTCDKQKDGPHFPPLQFSLCPAGKSCVLGAIGVTGAENSRRDRILLALQRTPEGARLGELGTATSIKTDTLSGDLKGLEANGLVRAEGKPRAHNRRYFITESGIGSLILSGAVEPVESGVNRHADG